MRLSGSGLFPSERGELLRNLAGLLSQGGLCVVNTTWGNDGTVRGETAHRLATHLSHGFDGVYVLEARSCRNVIARAHQGQTRDEAQWRAMAEAALLRASDVCPNVSAAQECVPRVVYTARSSSS